MANAFDPNSKGVMSFAPFFRPQIVIFRISGLFSTHSCPFAMVLLGI
jgi:hypothetical protein